MTRRARLLALEARVSALEHAFLSNQLDRLRDALDELGIVFDLTATDRGPTDPTRGVATE